MFDVMDRNALDNAAISLQPYYRKIDYKKMKDGGVSLPHAVLASSLVGFLWENKVFHYPLLAAALAYRPLKHKALKPHEANEIIGELAVKIALDAISEKPSTQDGIILAYFIEIHNFFYEVKDIKRIKAIHAIYTKHIKNIIKTFNKSTSDRINRTIDRFQNDLAKKGS